MSSATAANPNEQISPRSPRPVPVRAADSLAHANGYRVDGPSGRIGTVVGVSFGAWTDRPDSIDVRVGLFRRGVLMVSADSVAAVVPHEGRVVLSEEVDFAEAIRTSSHD